MLSNNYLLTWTGRFVFQFLLVMTGIAVLYGISTTQKTLFTQRTFLSNQIQQVEFQSLDDLNNSVQASLIKRRLEARNDVDLPKVLMGLLSPMTISNHFTDIVLFQSIIAVGWFTAGE